MVIVGDNLKGLAVSQNILPESDISEYSLTVRLGKFVCVPISGGKSVKYGKQDLKDFFDCAELENSELILGPGKAVLASSSSGINMPLGYMGLIQTKGTLARHLVCCHVSSGHIEPGFKGSITLEIVNNSPFVISIDVGMSVAEIFILRCSTDNTSPYNGKYSNSDGPSLPMRFI